ncbi:MAG: hypothetical protein R3F56_21315 [Planctomycetota bacterium]
MRLAFASLLLVVVLAQTQDPPPPQPPQGAAPLPQVPDVPMTPVQRKDLWQRFAPPSPIAGSYRLKAASSGGRIATTSIRGFLTIGQRHLTIQIQDETGTPGKPSIQSSVREYELRGQQLRTTARFGVRVPSGGTPVLEAEGLVEMRLVALTSTSLKILQPSGDYLEFERVE